MPDYLFRCKKGHEMTLYREVYARDQTGRCHCGCLLRRIFTPTAALITPPYMKAPGSVNSSAGAVDRQERYLKSNRHKRDMQQSERIADRVGAAKQDIANHVKKNLSDDVVGPKIADRRAQRKAQGLPE